MPAGNYRELITIERPVADAYKDDFGHINPASSANWETLTTCWADVLISGSREFQRVGITRAEVTHAIRIRHSTAALAITSASRIRRADGKLLNVAGTPFDATNQRRELVIPAIG